MRRNGSAGAPGALSAPYTVLLIAVLLSAVLLSACQRTPGATAPADGGLGGATPGPATTAVRPSGYGAVFLAVGECSSFGTTSFTEVGCASERAAAR
ncbi:hypothetical protein NGM37_42345, partial [Streptomyces sp. TRM76130]|nr:hypothetical protein [Streptomyces sp. TRM76130]